MKRQIILLIVLLSGLVVQAEQSYTLFNTLNSNQDYHYKANSHIVLSTGFQSAPSNGHEVTLEIDSYGVFPPQNGITGGMTANNNGGVVGSLGGIVDVGLLGSAIYTIPIDLPQGLGGIQPQLSISYNSQNHNGLLGWAWDLNGISSITRTGGTNYHDGYTSAVNYSQDRFCLDGNRLMKVSSGSYGGNGTSYRTELDQMSKIVSYHESGISGPSYFKVWAADGKIYHYGSSVDSKALMNSQNYVNIWLLKKVEDRNGNGMEYHYSNESNTFRLSKITYSSNANDNISPAFTVQFQYNDRSDIEVSYVGNKAFYQNKILKGIIIKKGTNVMYSYQFNYNSPSPKNGYPYHLLSEIQLSAGDMHLNPTKIQWGSNNYGISSGSDIKLNVTTTGISNAFVNAVKFSGDFNGDGYTDVIATRPNSQGTYTSADVFLNRGVNGNAVFSHNTTFPLSSNISWIYVADYNGDGLDDIMLANRIRKTFPFPDQLSSTVFLSHLDSSGTLTFNTYQTPTCTIPHNMVDALLVGDFFGEGKSSVLIQSIANDKSNNSSLLSYDATNNQFQFHSFAESLSADRFYTADYNGDGMIEILFRNGSGTTSIVQVKKANDGTCQYSELYNGSPYNWNDCFPGDFNGDGMADALFYKSGDSSPWSIRLSSQLGISPSTYSLPATFPYSSPGNYLFSLDQPNHTIQYIKVGDFDGNGCSDIGLFKDNLFYVFYGPLRTSGEDAPFANSQRISTQFFNLYDNMTMCIGNFLGQDGLSYLGSNTITHLPSMALRHEVRKITDGMGRKTEFAYDYLMPKPSNPSENDFYRLNLSQGGLPQNSHYTALPLRALSKTTKYNIKNKPIETRCHYENGVLNTSGKGFLGFRKTKQDDYCNNQLQKKVIKQYNSTQSGNAFLLMTSSEHVFDGSSHLVAKSSYSNTLYRHLQNNKVIIPITDKVLEEYDVANPSKLLKKEIFETTVSTHCSNNNKYDDILSIVSQTKGITDRQDITSACNCEFQNTINTTYVNDNLTTWLINRPATTTNIFHRAGDYEDICQHKVFTYFMNKPHLLNTIRNIPNDGSHPEDRLTTLTIIQYDPTGNIKTKTRSTPNDNISPRTESYEYSKAYGGRLLTKYTDALNQTTNYSYDPIYSYRTSAIDCNGLETRYEQDPFGITRTTYNPDGTVTCNAIRWGNDYYYQWEKKTGQQTNITRYDATGEILQKRSYDINSDLLLTDYSYNDLGKITQKSFPYKIGESLNVLQYAYDNHLRVNRITHTDGTYETIQYDGNQRSTSMVSTNVSSRTETKDYNVMGWLTSSTDALGNSVIYDYYADGRPKSFQIDGRDETKIEITYDALGNRISLSDPDYGVMTSEYNAFNELTKSISPKSDETFYYYDALGRTIRRVEFDNEKKTSTTTAWHYGQGQGQLGLLMEIASTYHSIHYEYDDLQRVTTKSESISGETYQTRYTYDDASRVSSIIYPSEYKVNHNYTSEGQLKSIMDDQSKVLWKVSETNALLQPIKLVTGNGFLTEYDYDINTNRLNSIRTVHDNQTIQSYSYQYDDFSNMTHRNDLKKAFHETFTYDALDRITGSTDNNGSSHFKYDSYGRMTEKSNANGIVFTNADYSNPRPHAIKRAEATHGVFPQTRMNLAYTSFDKILSISEGVNNTSFGYGYDYQRIKTTERINGVIRKKVYVGGCEFINSGGSDPIVRTFLTSPLGVFAVVESINGNTKLHYIHKDHLGSWTTISDEAGNIEQENQFDPWGYCPNSDNLMFERGFTGHEHIRGTGLINMNGRLYDPITSSMLSPDNNIQMPDHSQNLNRYSYCFNNPLTYTDPDGNSAMLFYLMFCTDYGYEMQKFTSPAAFHLDLHLSSQQLGIGADCSIGIPKLGPIAARFHGGATYYSKYYDNSYSGMEYRAGMEWCLLGLASLSGTSFYQGDRKQTTNSIIVGGPHVSVTYENDYMFHLGDYLLGSFAADNGDRYRSAAAQIRIGLFEVGVNLFTGDPGVDHKDRRTYFNPNVESTFYDEEAGGRKTYTIGANGENPNEYRAGVFYVGFGPIRIGGNNEQIRNTFQNRFAHDYICKGDSPYFEVLDRPGQCYFYFGTGTGNSLW